VDFDKEQARNNTKNIRSIIMAALMGGTGVVIPFLSIFAATFKGVSDLSLFNSSMLMLLAILIILFLIIKSASAFFSNNPKLFFFGIVFIVADVISLISGLMIYLVL